MSTWYEAKDDDIDLHVELEAVNILVTSNDSGNVYVTMTWEQLDVIYAAKELAVKLMEGK